MGNLAHIKDELEKLNKIGEKYENTIKIPSYGI